MRRFGLGGNNNLVIDVSGRDIDGLIVKDNLVLLWNQTRELIVVPFLWGLMYLCSILSVMLFVERVYMAIVILLVKVLRIKRYTKYNVAFLKQETEASKSHPMVLVQIPMFNEKEVRV